MAALIGADLMQVGKLITDLGLDGCLEIANFNSPGQIVISGQDELIKLAMEKAPEYGIKKVIPLNVSSAFHCSMMDPAREKFSRELAVTKFHPMKYPVVTNADCAPNQDHTELPGILSDQIANAVLWEQSIRLMLSEGVELFIEFGPTVLTPMLKRGFSDLAKFEAFPVNNPEQVRYILSWLKEKGVSVSDF